MDANVDAYADTDADADADKDAIVNVDLYVSKRRRGLYLYGKS